MPGPQHSLRHQRSLTGETNRLEPAIDAIALEIQRSFDFYERNFAQMSIGSLMVAPQEFETGCATERFAHVHSVSMSRLLDLAANSWHVPDPLPRARAGRCLLAIGAALRDGRGRDMIQQINLYQTGPHENHVLFFRESKWLLVPGSRFSFL